MNYYGARQRLSDGRWDYTCKNDGSTWPLGYCAGSRAYSASDFNFMGEEAAAREAQKLNERNAPHLSKFHKDGHATEAEAAACYRAYLLDMHLRFSDKPSEDEQHRCAACGAWTQHLGWLEGSMGAYLWHLCAAHQTREAVEALMPPVGTSISSY